MAVVVTLVVAAVIGHLYSQNHCLQMKWRQEQKAVVANVGAIYSDGHPDAVDVPK